MNAQSFWNVIGLYNKNTIIIQIIFIILIAFSAILSYTHKCTYLIKIALGVTDLFIGIIFFGYYGTEPIQKYFALPLYICCGVLFLYEAWSNKKDQLKKPNHFQIVLLILYCLYPLISYLLGNSFPEMVTYIMPCPIVSISIAIYAGYARKNKLLLALLTLWGLTGIKSIIFNAYEDIILLICGIYGVYLLINEHKRKKQYN